MSPSIGFFDDEMCYEQRGIGAGVPPIGEGLSMTTLRNSALAVVLLALMVSPAFAQDAAAPPAAVAPAATSGKLVAVLLGDIVVGDDGDPDGKGSATISIDGGKLCYEIEYHRLAPVTMAHIHAGAAGKAGDPVVSLKLDQNEDIKGCTAVSPEMAAALLADPSNYYIDVHTNELPKGAIRGQLGK